VIWVVLTGCRAYLDFVIWVVLTAALLSSVLLEELIHLGRGVIGDGIEAPSYPGCVSLAVLISKYSSSSARCMDVNGANETYLGSVSCNVVENYCSVCTGTYCKDAAIDPSEGDLE
jgi:hypothetical protein